MAKKRPVTNDLSEAQKLDIIRNKTVEQKMKRRTVSKWIALLLLIALLITGSAWGVLSLVEYNSMKISIDKESTGLVLSETADFAKPTSFLDMKGPENMAQTTYSRLDMREETLAKDGALGASGYIAYTMYLKNAAEYKSLQYTTNIVLKNKKKDAEKAMRIMVVTYREDHRETQEDGSEKIVYTEPEIVVYAEQKAEDTSEYIAYDSDDFELQKPISLAMLNAGKDGFEGAIQLTTNETKPFLGYSGVEGDWEHYIDKITDQQLTAGEVVKYTVFMWLEGSDAQCKDEIIGGYCTVEITFSVQDYQDIRPIG